MDSISANRIFDKVRHYFSKSFVNIVIKDNENIFDLGLVDSLFAMQIVLFVESEFNIECNDEDLDIENFCSIENICKFLSKKLKS